MAGEAEVAVKFTAVGADAFVKAAGSVRSSLQGFNTGVDSLIGSTRSAVSEVTGFVTNILLMPQAILNTAKAIKALAETVKGIVIGFAASTDKIVDVKVALDRMTGSASNTRKMLATLRQATDGQVTDFELMRLATKNLSSQFKLSDADLATLLRGIKASTEAVGEEFGPAVNRLNLFLKTGRTSTLALIPGFDKLRGIASQVKDEMKGLSGTTAVQAQTTRLLQEAVKVADEQFKKLGGSTETASDLAVRFETSIQNISTSFDIAFGSSERLKQSFELIDDVMKSLFGSTENFGKTIGEKLASALASTIDTVVRSLPSLVDALQQTIAVGTLLISGIFPGLVTGLNAMARVVSSIQKAKLQFDIFDFEARKALTLDPDVNIQLTKQIRQREKIIEGIEKEEFEEKGRSKAVIDAAKALGSEFEVAQGKLRNFRLELAASIADADRLAAKRKEITETLKERAAGVQRGELRPTLEVLLNISFDETSIERKAAEAKDKIEQAMKTRAREAELQAQLDQILAEGNILDAFLPGLPS